MEKVKWVKWVVLIEIQVLLAVVVGLWIKANEQDNVIKLQIERIMELEEMQLNLELSHINEGDIILGNPAAENTIIMYTRFDCPVCDEFFKENYEALKNEYLVMIISL